MTYDEWARSQESLPAPPGLGSITNPNLNFAAIGQPVYNFLRNAERFLGSRPTTNPSFTPMPGERLALQMPNARNRFSQFMFGSNGQYGNFPPGLRDMPRAQGAPYIPERNTQVIPGPMQQATPYPRPPFLNFGNWLNTGERGPVPLDAISTGRYPAPYYTPMPGVYDARTSGGALA
jgi:hypothetical protein